MVKCEKGLGELIILQRVQGMLIPLIIICLLFIAVCGGGVGGMGAATLLQWGAYSFLEESPF